MVSIIVPVYNTGKVLDKCLKSILAQTYTDWECIVVNDCSTDKKTLSVLIRWKNKLVPQFHFLDKATNEGVDMARFTALEMAKGDYVTFVDSDDWLEPTALAVLMNNAREHDADVVVGRNRKVFLGGLFNVSSKDHPEWLERVIVHDELIRKYYLSFFGVNILPINVWATLYKKSLFSDAGVQPSYLKFGEDQVMNMWMFPFIKRYYAIPDTIYNYRVGLPGTSDKYLNFWLENARKLYTIKIAVCEAADIKDCVFFQQVEMMNFLKTYVNGCLRYRKNQRQENIFRLSEELRHPLYGKLSALLSSRYRDKDAVRLIVKGDAEAFYTLMEGRYRSLPLKQRLIDVCVRMVRSVFSNT